MAIVIDDPLGIEMYQLITLRAALKLEWKGMKRSRRPAAFDMARKEFDIPRRASYQDAIDKVTYRIEEIYNQRKGR